MKFMKRKLKQSWPTMPSISIKRTIASDIKPLNIKNTTSYDGNTGHDLVTAQKCDGVIPVPLIIGTSTTTQHDTYIKH
jgi:hypothetical protein